MSLLDQLLEKRAPFNGMRGKRGEELDVDMGGRGDHQVTLDKENIMCLHYFFYYKRQSELS